MRIYLDSDLIDDSGTTLGSAVAIATERAGCRLLIGVTADGQPVPDDLLAQPPVDSPFAEEIYFVSADPVALVRVTLLEAADELESSKARQSAIARKIQLGDLGGAMPDLAALLDVWQQVEQCITLSRQVGGIELGELPGGTRFDTIATDLTQRLAEIRDALTARDLATLADILGYDMDEQADTWTGVLRDLAAGCRTTEVA